MRTLTLKSPITTHNGDIAEIKFTEQKARSFIKHGSPYKTEINRETNAMSFVWNNRAAMSFIADMSGIDESALEEMTGNDFERCKTVIYDAVNGTTGNGDNPLS